MALTIIANIIAKKDHINRVQHELLKLIDTTRAEEGCIKYDLHQDTQEPAHFVFYEIWESRDLWQKHINNTHLKEYLEKTEGLVDQFTVQELTIVS